MPNFTCGHQPWMGIRCDECSPKVAPEQIKIIPCPSCAAKDARIALLEKVVDAAREIDGCEFAERCETWMLDDLEAALRALDGGGK
jgi:hypothetical protein